MPIGPPIPPTALPAGNAPVATVPTTPVLGPPIPDTGTPASTPGFESTLTIVQATPASFAGGTTTTALAGAAMRLDSGDISIEMMYAPSESTYDGLEQPSTAVARPGRQAITMVDGDSLPVFSFTATLGYSSPEYSVEGQLRTLRALARTGKVVAMEFGAFTANTMWRITRLSEAHQLRNKPLGEITRATVDISLTEVPTFLIQSMPISATVLIDPAPVITPKVQNPILWNTGSTVASVDLGNAILAAAKKSGSGVKVTAGDVYDSTRPTATTNPNNPPTGATVDIPGSLRQAADRISKTGK